MRRRRLIAVCPGVTPGTRAATGRPASRRVGAGLFFSEESTPQYFFHIADGAILPDREGMEPAGREEAWGMAIRFIGEVLRDRGNAVRPGQGWTPTVVEEETQICWRLQFKSQAFVPDPREPLVPA